MSKLDSLLQNTQISISQNTAARNEVNVILNPAPRLIVLVSGADLDDLNLTRQIWGLAKPQALEVVLLALCNIVDQEAQLRCKLVTMTAIIHDETIHVDFHIGHGNSWLKLAREEWRPGDILACGSDQQISLWGRTLSEALAVNFKMPVHVLSNLHSSPHPSLKILSTILFWLGSIAILAGFLEVEIKITQLQQDWAHTFLLYLCVFIETGLIWVWNALF